MRRVSTVRVVLGAGVVCLLSGCAQVSRYDQREFTDVLLKGKDLPHICSGYFVEFGRPRVYCSYVNRQLSYFMLNLECSELESVGYGDIPNESAFLIYLDEDENWTVLADLYRLIGSKTSGPLYIAVQSPVGNYAMVPIESAANMRTAVRLELDSSKRVFLRNNDRRVEFSGVRDPMLHDALVKVQGNHTDMRCAVFVSGSSDIKIGEYLDALGMIKRFTLCKPYLEVDPESSR